MAEQAGDEMTETYMGWRKWEEGGVQWEQAGMHGTQAQVVGRKVRWQAIVGV